MSLKIELRNFQAVKKADVELSDLTVLAGVNASGKSTIARLFHTVVEANRNYEIHADRVSVLMGDCSAKLLSFYSALQKLHIGAGEILKWISDVHFGKENAFDEGYERILGILVEKSAELLNVDAVKKDARWLESLGREVGENFADPKEVGAWVRRVMHEVREHQIECRSGKESTMVYGMAFSLADLVIYDAPKVRIKILDGDSLIFATNQSVSKRNVVYSPDCSIYLRADRLSYPISENASGVMVGNDTYKLKPDGKNLQVVNARLERLIHGRFSKPSDASSMGNDWLLSGGEGASEYSIPIRKSADGIRALAPIAMLDKYGLLNPNTLLVVDEPESHLHPQWIVEVADLLVWLVKERKMRVLVATHSPYLVRALKTASLAKLESGQLRYYLANAVKDNSGDEKYEYIPLGDDISPIFKVFNVALDKISFYQR